MKVKYDMDMIQNMSLFEKVTHSKLKDAFFSDDKLVFVVFPGQMGKALGKNRVNLLKLEKLMKKKLKMVEFSENMPQFVMNAIFPLRVDDLVVHEGVVTLRSADTRTKGLLIGMRAKNLRALEKIVQRYFSDVVEIKVE